MRALVIDDDDIAREMMAGTLEDAGWKVFRLPSPIGATRQIIEHEVDAVVLDVMMPETSGDKLAKMLRGNSKLQKVGIVLVSSIESSELRRLCRLSGANGGISKAEIGTGLVRAVRHAVRDAAG